MIFEKYSSIVGPIKLQLFADPEPEDPPVDVVVDDDPVDPDDPNEGDEPVPDLPVGGDDPPADPPGDADWKKRYKSPEEMFDDLKKIQSDRDKLKSGEPPKKTEPEPDPEPELSFEEQFEVDPKTAILNLVRDGVQKSVGGSMNYVATQRLNGIMDEVKKIYPDFDFDKNNKNLEKELSKFSEDYRAKEPVKALMSAVETIVGPEYKKKIIAADIEKKKNAHTEGKSLKPPKKVEKDDQEIDDIIKATEEKNLLT